MRRERYSLVDEWPSLVAGAVAAVWRWRLELGLVGGLYVAWSLLENAVGPVAASVVLVGVIAGVLRPAKSRNALVRWLKAARVRRRWRRAWLDVGLPRVAARRVRQVPAGELVRIRCSRGSSIPHVERHAEQLAACLGAREVRISRDKRHAAWGTALLVRRDPLDGVTKPWPWAGPAGPTSLWEPFPVGVDEFGGTVTMRLPNATCSWAASREPARAPRCRWYWPLRRLIHR
jgi:hypothetical protein